LVFPRLVSSGASLPPPSGQAARDGENAAVAEGVQQTILGLPDDFEMTEEQAGTVDVDAIIAGASYEHGLWGAIAPLVAAREAAQERDEQRKVRALQLLVVVAGMTPTDDARGPFGRYMSGSDGAGNPWHTPLPADLTQSHVDALLAFLAVARHRSCARDSRTSCGIG
jgi:hypothetical protein